MNSVKNMVLFIPIVLKVTDHIVPY